MLVVPTSESLREITLAKSSEGNRLVLCFGLMALVHLLSTLFVGLAIPFPWVDEHAHVSYVVQQSKSLEVFPSYRDLRIVDRDDLTNISDEFNQLNHPSFYYMALSVFVEPDRPAETQVRRLRLVNVAISLAAVVLLLAAGARMFSRLGDHMIYALAIIACPKISVYGGGVNNDTLALLGAAIALHGLIDLS